MSGKTDRRITFLSLTTAALPPDGSGGNAAVVARLVWRWFSTQYEAETFVFSRIYCNIRKPLMPIRYPIAFRGTARPSVCSAWRLKVPKLGAFPKIFACFSLICSSRNPMSCRNPDALPKPFACFSLICSSRNPRFSWNLERLCISVKPRLAFVISETCKPFSSLSAFSPFSATKAVLRV